MSANLGPQLNTVPSKPKAPSGKLERCGHRSWIRKAIHGVGLKVLSRYVDRRRHILFTSTSASEASRMFFLT